MSVVLIVVVEVVVLIVVVVAAVCHRLYRKLSYFIDFASNPFSAIIDPEIGHFNNYRTSIIGYTKSAINRIEQTFIEGSNADRSDPVYR